MKEDAWESRYRQARRAATGTNVLGYLMVVFLMGFGYWWYQVWSVIFRPTFLTPQWTITILVAIVYTVILPLFLSMVVPNSPAGRLLQKQTWALPGQIVTGITAALLIGVATRIFGFWLDGQPGIAETSMYYPAMLAMITGAIVLPAITWTMTTPEKLIALYRQARIAKQLDQQAQLEDLKWKAMHARFVMIAMSDMRTLTIEKFGAYCDELTTMLAAGAREEERRLSTLESTFGLIQGFELKASDPEERDEGIIEEYRHIGKLLTNTAEQVLIPARYADTLQEVNETHADSHAADMSGHRDESPHMNPRLQSIKPHQSGDATRHRTAPYGIEYARAAWDVFGRTPWTIKQLATKLAIGETTAKDLKDHWLVDGVIAQTNQNGRWYFTEREVVS